MIWFLIGYANVFRCSRNSIEVLFDKDGKRRIHLWLWIFGHSGKVGSDTTHWPLLSDNDSGTTLQVPICFNILNNKFCILRLGGSPFGPAGTGKTESVKALGNQLGRFVLVFNCDETFDFQVLFAYLYLSGIVHTNTVFF